MLIIMEIAITLLSNYNLPVLQSVDVTSNASTIVGREICLHKCVVFRLGLGSKILAVRADPDDCVKDVLGPVLLKYGFIFERTVIHIVSKHI